MVGIKWAAGLINFVVLTAAACFLEFHPLFNKNVTLYQIAKEETPNSKSESFEAGVTYLVWGFVARLFFCDCGCCFSYQCIPWVSQNAFVLITAHLLLGVYCYLHLTMLAHLSTVNRIYARWFVMQLIKCWVQWPLFSSSLALSLLARISHIGALEQPSGSFFLGYSSGNIINKPQRVGQKSVIR